MSAGKKKHLLFLTGKLAEKRLHKVLESMQPVEFTYEIRNVGITVAALMTGRMLLRRLAQLEGVDQIIVPGMCRGDLAAVTEQFGIPVHRGPEDLKDLPEYFGHAGKAPDLSRYDVRIFAEITDAPMLTVEEIITRAGKFRDEGADIIDIGCLPDTPFPHLEDTVLALHDYGFKVSVDSLEDDELVRGGQAGADYLLSLKESTAWIADEVASTPVLIPEQHTDLASLIRLIEKFSNSGRNFIADSILDPVHFGFSDSLIRYCELRKQCPEIEIMMGIGNLTELTEADTTGINAILFGMISELHINNVLATVVSPHARSAIREADKARRIMFAAREEGSLPKDFDSSLLTVHSRKPFPYNTDEIRELATEIRDPSYRIMVSEEGIHIFNRDGIHTAANPYDLFPVLDLLQDDAPHAFYIGVELARAQIALQLGKHYMQDEELDWGVAGNPVAKEKQESIVKAAHTSQGGGPEYKQAGSTLQAGKKRKRKKKKA